MIPHKYELLSPAGSMEALKAAVENGADAVYFGLQEHNARQRAENFTKDDLSDVIDYCHYKDVNAYMVFNTLIYNEEFDSAIKTFEHVVSKGIDGVIIQDVGVGNVFKKISPDIPLHASTQMTVTSVESAQFAKELGYSRVILARELSLAEIERICKHVDIEVETFVHGALCMAYSGQCLTSSFWGGRSANRGECAQACRLPYTLSDYREGNQLNSKNKLHLLSPGDFNLIHELEKLKNAGVMTFKIEGRLKSAEYVTSTTKAYRKALDHILYQTDALNMQDEVDMEQVFSRGYIPFFIDGKKDHKRTVQGEFPKSRGLEIGRVVSTSKHRTKIEIRHSLSLGDGIVMAVGLNEVGGNVNKIWINGKEHKQAEAGSVIEIPIGNAPKNARVWKSNDPKLAKRLRETFENPKHQKKLPLHFHVEGDIGTPLTLIGTDAQGSSETVQSEMQLERALNQPLTYDKLYDQLDRLGNTSYRLESLSTEFPSPVILPLKELNQLRRQLIEKLDLKRVEDRRNRYQLNPKDNFWPTSEAKQLHAPQLKIVVRQIEQVEAACKTDVDVIVFDFNDLKFFRQAAEICQTYNKEYHIATPRIQKPKEEGFFKVIEKLKPNGVLIRNLGSLHHFKHTENFVITGDYSLNIVNDFSKYQFEQYGMQRLTPSFEIDTKQLKEMVKDHGENIEMAVHYQVPSFHSEYCHWVGNLVESGKAKPGCGELCQHRPISVTDRKGIEHPIQSDAFCRNTVFHGIPVSYLHHIQFMRERGINSFRIELVYDTENEIKMLVDTYKSVIDGELSPNEAYRHLNTHYPFGVESGKM